MVLFTALSNGDISGMSINHKKFKFVTGEVVISRKAEVNEIDIEMSKPQKLPTFVGDFTDHMSEASRICDMKRR
jgi:hypothetical protein